MSGKLAILATVAACSVLLGACAKQTSDQDYGFDGAMLEERSAGIWIDGNGCDHWILDDGLEGYMSPRLTEDGKPVCRKGSIPYTTIDFERSLFGE